MLVSFVWVDLENLGSIFITYHIFLSHIEDGFSYILVITLKIYILKID